MWERTLDEILLKEDWRKVKSWECLFFHRKALLFLLVYVDDCKMIGRKESLAPMRRKPAKAHRS